jgi:predicted TIM-barrel fold metal-dependent hydrolase
MMALKQVAGIDQIVFGTDYPYSTMVDDVQGLASCGAFNVEELEQIYRGKVRRMMPQRPASTSTT